MNTKQVIRIYAASSEQAAAAVIPNLCVNGDKREPVRFYTVCLGDIETYSRTELHSSRISSHIYKMLHMYMYYIFTYGYMILVSFDMLHVPSEPNAHTSIDCNLNAVAATNCPSPMSSVDSLFQSHIMLL